MPAFRLAIYQKDATTQASILNDVAMVINQVKKDAMSVRRWYLDVLEAAQYLESCTQLALDFYDCQEALDELDDVTRSSRALRSALHDVRMVHSRLADPSDFWLLFHATELELLHIEEPLLRASATTGPEVFAALEKLCLQYITPYAECGQRWNEWRDENLLHCSIPAADLEL
jgi:hypothetical protein